MARVDFFLHLRLRQNFDLLTQVSLGFMEASVTPLGLSPCGGCGSRIVLGLH